MVKVVNGLSQNNQVIITTHNPLFVQRNNIHKNVVIDNGTARVAKSVAEVRDILGIWPSDNLRSARFVLVVEGNDDKESLAKILPLYSRTIGEALSTNKLAIKALGGASNLSHDLNDLQHSLCEYVVLLDNDNAGNEAAIRAKERGLLDDARLRQTNCQGSPEAEFEDCLNPDIYVKDVEDKYKITIKKNRYFRNNKKWSDRMRDVFLDQGIKWTETIEKDVKSIVSKSVPNNGKLENIIIPQKSGFLGGLKTAIERMLEVEE